MIAAKAKSAAKARFEEYLNRDGDGFAEKVKEVWAKEKPKFLAQEGNAPGVFSFRWLANEHHTMNELSVKEVLSTMDDFKGEMDHVQVYKWRPDKPTECEFDVSIVYGNLRDKEYTEMVDEHKRKKRRTDETPVKKEARVAPPPLRREESVKRHCGDEGDF